MAEKHITSKKKMVKAGSARKKAKGASTTDLTETAKLVKAGRTSTANAIRASRALGLAITYMQDGILYKEYPDGKKEKIASGEVKKSNSDKKAYSLKKGMVLHAKK